MSEEARRRRSQQSDTADYTRTTAWGTNPVTVSAADGARISGIVQLEIASGGSVRVCEGGETASATNGHLLDATNGPANYDILGTGAVSVYAVSGTPAVTTSSLTKSGVSL